jgi:hypothetical protein
MLGEIPCNVAPRWGWPHDPESWMRAATREGSAWSFKEYFFKAEFIEVIAIAMASNKQMIQNWCISIIVRECNHYASWACVRDSYTSRRRPSSCHCHHHRRLRRPSHSHHRRCHPSSLLVVVSCRCSILLCSRPSCLCCRHHHGPLRPSPVTSMYRQNTEGSIPIARWLCMCLKLD